MKTINFELSKRLNDLWLLDNIETEYWYFEQWDLFNIEEIFWKKYYIQKWDWLYKTLTLEEAIEFMPIYIKWKYKFNYEKFNKVVPYSNMRKWDKHWIKYTYNWEWYIQYWKTLLEAIEEMLEWLLNNWLLNKNK